MKQRVPMAVLLLALTGCLQVPFPESALVLIGSEDAQRIVERFQAGMPDSFQLLNTIVFEYNSRKFSLIGSIEVDRRNGLFRAMCMNPMGVKLFELTGDRTTVTNEYTIAAFSRYGDITTVIGNDIRRIYFDLAPSSAAVVWRGTNTVRFRQHSGAGSLEYVFSGGAGDLLAKNFYDDNGIVWQVRYYDYREQSGKRMPHGILFVHYEFGYHLTVREKEFHL